MKGIKGLILAIGLGITGALFNLAYLASKAKEVETVSFIGINPEKFVDRGEKLSEDHIVAVPIPKAFAHNLDQFAFLYASKESVLNLPVSRNVPGGRLLLREDMESPRQELAFGPGKDEVAMHVAVDSGRTVPSLYNPGDLVSFMFPKFDASKKVAVVRASETKPAVAKPADAKPADAKPAGEGAPTLAPTPDPAASGEMSPVLNMVEIVGPFKILAMGNRLGNSDVMRSAKIAQLQENVITVAAKLEGGQLDPTAQKLWALMQVTNAQNIGVLLHARGGK